MKDFIGNTLQEGDFISYCVGSSSNIAIHLYNIVSIDPQDKFIRVNKVRKDHFGNWVLDKEVALKYKSRMTFIHVNFIPLEAREAVYAYKRSKV